MKNVLLSVAALLPLATACAACDAGAPPTAHERGQVAVTIAPLDLPELGNACYTVSVTSGGGQVVWSRSGLCADAYGDGRGAISYVGTCDAGPGAAANVVGLTLEGVWDTDGGVIPPASYLNPTATAALTQTVTCRENEDVPVTFNLTLLRAATQGFFDVAVAFRDFFCSAKLDCERDPGTPLELVFDPVTHVRLPTAVLAFACTGGEDTATWLYLSDLSLTCGAGTTVVAPSEGPGNLSAVPGSTLPGAAIREALVTRGSEQLGSYHKRYWSVALGLGDVTGCTLSAEGTASDGALPGGQTPADTTWPYLAWSGPLDSCTSHGLDSGDGVVTTAYTALAGRTFAHAFDGTTALRAVSDLVGAGTFADAARWGDGTFAASCDAYRHPAAGYSYTGAATGDGWYLIDPTSSGTATAALCDMTTDGGGWTQVLAWDREFGTDTTTTLGTAMTLDLNTMGDFGNPTGRIRWADYNASGDVLAYHRDVAVPNGGELRLDVHWLGDRMSNSGVWMYATVAGAPANVLCQEDNVANDDRYSVADRAWIPYTCANVGDIYGNTIFDEVAVRDFGAPITALHLRGLQMDHYLNGPGYAYLYRYSGWVR